MNSEYNQIYESYKRKILNEMDSGNSPIGYDQQDSRQLQKGLRPKSPGKDSFGGVQKTAQLPGGSETKIPAGAINGPGSGAAVEMNEEERYVEGFGKMSKADLHMMYNRVMNQVHQLKATGKVNQIQSKLELLKLLAKYL